MPDREFAPGALIFYANPYGPEQYQPIYFREWAFETTFTQDEACRSWLILPNGPVSSFAIGVRPGAAGTYLCSVGLARNNRSVGSVRVFLNVGSEGRAGSTAGIAAPTALTITGSTRAGYLPHSISVNGDSYYATLVGLGSIPRFAVSYPPFTAFPGKVTIDEFSSPSVPVRHQLYIETPAGMEVVQLNFQDNGDQRLTVNPPTVNLEYSAGGRPPSASVRVTSPHTVEYPVIGESSARWLTVTPSTRQDTPVTYDLAFDTSGLPNGLNSATLTLRSSGAGTVTVPVVMRVTGSTVAPGQLTVSPTSLSFNTVIGGATTDSRDVSVGAVSATGYTVSAVTHSGGSGWLRLSPQGLLNTATAPTILARVDTAGLSSGTYTGTITVAATATQFSRAIPVTLTVSASQPPPRPVLTVSSATLAFSYREGAAPPPTASIELTGTAGLSFSARTVDAAGWLSVSPSSGVLAASGVTVTVAVDARGLPPGVYSGRISIDPANEAAPPVIVTVTLTVSAALPIVSRVVNAASYSDGPIAAGEMITIFGDHLGPDGGALLSMTAENKVATSAGGVEVLVGGYPAPILYAGKTQVSAIVPYEIASPFIVSPPIQVRYRGQTSNGFPSTQASSAPGIFTADASGKGRGAILNADFTPNSPDRAAAPGDIVQIFVTGEGQTTPPGVTGKVTTVATTGPLTPQPLIGVAVLIDGRPAKIHFYGEAPSLVAGLMQLNVEIPPGTLSGDVPVLVVLGSEPDQRASQDGVTVSIR